MFELTRGEFNNLKSQFVISSYWGFNIYPFQLTQNEFDSLRSQIVISKEKELQNGNADTDWADREQNLPHS